MKYLIYALFDPRDGEIRYVGKSCSGLARPRQHKSPSSLKDRTRRGNWIRQLLSSGHVYNIAVLYQASVQDQLCDAERYWIKELRGRGCRLTNETDGGDGWSPGKKHTTETKARISVALSGKPKSPEQQERLRNVRRGATMPTEAIEAMRAKLTGRKRAPYSEEWRQHMSESKKGKKLSEEHKQKLAKVWKGRHHTDETRAKQSAARMGWKPSEETRKRMSDAAKARCCRI